MLQPTGQTLICTQQKALILVSRPQAKPRGKLSAAGALLADLDSTARRAVAAVEEAMTKLPPESDLKYSVMEEGGYGGGFGGERAPENPGSKVLCAPKP